ncbi:hypothetical protein LCGC14_2233850 [marine sediment metagenome]|uniref:Uncharacterized protein n=1 Tax=marine sediment metagenome TaxID=412755 RepID=A0A0F9D7M9_9ZZZZ
MVNMSEILKITSTLIEGILYYKKKKKINKISDLLIDIHEEPPEIFSKFLLNGYLRTRLEKKLEKKLFLDDFNPLSADGQSILNKIKEDLRSFFYLLIDILSKTILPIENLEQKKKGLLLEYKKIKDLSLVQFYNLCLATVELKKQDLVKHEEIVEEKDTISSLLTEEKFTLGYFLLINELYEFNFQNKDYYWGPFYYQSFPSNYVELNIRHDKFQQALYPKESELKPNDVIKTLISKNLLVVKSGNWSKSRKTYFQSTVSVNEQLKTQSEKIQKIIIQNDKKMQDVQQDQGPGRLPYHPS